MSEAPPTIGYMRSLPVVSFFSGAMGLDLGLSQAGLDIAVGQELDGKAIATIVANGHRAVAGDLRALLAQHPALDPLLEAGRIRRGDAFAVVGGPPCQPFSTAGRRQGIADERGQLVFDYLRAIDALRPRFAVIENVKGLVSAPGETGGSLVDEILTRLDAMGYVAAWAVIDAVQYGAAQFRERLIIIASRDGEDVFVPAPTHFQHHQDPAYRWRTLATAIADLESIDQEGARFSAKTQAVLDLVPEGGNWRSLPAHVAEPAMGGAWRSGGGKVGFFRRLSYREPSPTLVTSPIQKATMLAHPTLPRPLSVREYARIQGFPDQWNFVGSTADKYRQIGNAVPIALGRAVGQALLATASGDARVRTRRTRGTSTLAGSDHSSARVA